MSSPPAEPAGVFTSRWWGIVSTVYLIVASAALPLAIFAGVFQAVTDGPHTKALLDQPDVWLGIAVLGPLFLGFLIATAIEFRRTVESPLTRGRLFRRLVRIAFGFLAPFGFTYAFLTGPMGLSSPAGPVHNSAAADSLKLRTSASDGFCSAPWIGASTRDSTVLGIDVRVPARMDARILLMAEDNRGSSYSFHKSLELQEGVNRILGTIGSTTIAWPLRIVTAQLWEVRRDGTEVAIDQRSGAVIATLAPSDSAR